MGRYTFDVLPASDGAGCVLAAGPRGELKGVPQSVTIDVGRACSALVFLHTAHHLLYGPKTFGQYVMVYADGQEETAPIRHTINIGPWRRSKQWGWWRGERTRGYYWQSERAWVGYTLGGDEIDLVAYEWVNPRPRVPVQAVRLEVADKSPGLAVGLFALTALDRR